MGGLQWSALVSLAVLMGCQSSRTAHLEATKSPMAIDRPQTIPSRTIRSIGRQDHSTSEKEPSAIRLTSATTNRAEPAAESAIAGVELVSLPQCLAMALEQNPDLIALRESDAVGSAAIGTAQTYPFNPFVQVQATPFQDAVQGGPGTTYHYVLLMQTIQLAHQQQYREQGAAASLNSTRWNIHQAELQNVAQTARLYFNVLYLRGILDLLEANHRNNQELLRILEKQLEAGQATAADVAIARVDAQSTRQQTRLAKANHETSLRELKRHLAVAHDAPFTLSKSLSDYQWKIPDLLRAAARNASNPRLATSDELQQSIGGWTAYRPDVMAAHSDVDVARAAMSLATAARTPDLQIGPYYQRTADGTTFLGFRAQTDLPLVNSGRPLERQRIAEFNQRVIVWEQLQRRAELEGQAAWERYELALNAVLEMETDPLTDLPNELQSLEKQFVAGEVDVVRVIQARASIIQSRRAHLDLLNELAQSAANLIGATGIPVDNLLNLAR